MPTLIARFFAVVLAFGSHTQVQHHSTAFVPPNEYASSIDCNIPSRHDLLYGNGNVQ